jgi:hypothetical protein
MAMDYRSGRHISGNFPDIAFCRRKFEKNCGRLAGTLQGSKLITGRFG